MALRALPLGGGLRGLQIGAEVPRALDDASADRQALRFESSQRRHDLVEVERRRQCCCIVRRLGDAGRDVGPRDERRVADDGDAPERHARRLEIVDRLQDRLVDHAHHFADRLAADQRRRDRYRVGVAGVIGQQAREFGALVRRPVPHHVVAAMSGTQVIVGSRDRIAKTLLARRQAEGHEIEQLAVDRRWKRRFGDERAPGDVADVARGELRQALLADGGTKSIRAHQQLAFRRPAIGKLREHRPFRLHEAADAAAAVVVLARKRIAQQPVDTLPGGQNLGTFEFRGHATGRIEDFAGRDLDPEIGWIDVDPAHRLDQVGLGDDAGATPREFALDPLEDVDLPAGAPQQQRGQEAAHRAADDERTPLGLAHSARSCRFLPRKIAIYRAKPGGMPWP